MALSSCRTLRLVTMHCEISNKGHDSLITTKEDLQKIYPARFEGIVNFDGEFHITTDRNVTAEVHAPCIMFNSYARGNQVGARKYGVAICFIKRVTQPTDWVSSIVYSRKALGRLKICLDPKDLSRTVKRPHYRTPTLDEVPHKLAGAKLFSQLDARHGYWSVSLDEESSLKTTFKGALYRIQILCRRYTCWSYPAGLTIADPQG